MVGGGSFCGDWGVVALVMDFKGVMLTSPPELAYCGGGGGGGAVFSALFFCSSIFVIQCFPFLIFVLLLFVFFM